MGRNKLHCKLGSGQQLGSSRKGPSDSRHSDTVTVSVTYVSLTVLLSPRGRVGNFRQHGPLAGSESLRLRPARALALERTSTRHRVCGGVLRASR